MSMRGWGEMRLLYLPLKGGGRRAQRVGWGSSCDARPPPGRLRRPPSPFQGEGYLRQRIRTAAIGIFGFSLLLPTAITGAQAADELSIDVVNASEPTLCAEK